MTTQDRCAQAKDAEHSTARVHLARSMQQGRPWQEAVHLAGLRVSRATAYRLHQRMRHGGEQALQEGRHGHPTKLRDHVRQWLKETCQQTPHTPSSVIQRLL